MRYFNAAGASPAGDLGEDHDPETHLIPIVLGGGARPAAGDHDFWRRLSHADGTCIRDYIHVDDLGTAHVKALERLEPGKGLQLNLGTGQGYSVREVIDACRRVSGRPIPKRSARAGRAIRRNWWPIRAGPQKAARLAPGLQRHRVDRRDRLALALRPSPRLRRLAENLHFGPMFCQIITQVTQDSLGFAWR